MADLPRIDGSTATLLTTGKVLFAGGEDDTGRFKTAELFDPATGVLAATGDMTEPRSEHVAVLLPNGIVLITGGEGWGIGDFFGGKNVCCGFLGSLASAELYDSSAGSFTATGGMTARRELQTSTLLNNGQVLITGGLSYGGIGIFYGSLSSAEIYTPSVSVPAPVLLSLSGDGQGQGAIQHAGTIRIASANDPAVVGEYLSIYLTGLLDGSVIPPQLAIGGRLAEITFFGNVPGYPGLNVINIRMPSGVAAGPAVPVRLTYIGRPSNAVTIGVQ
jgi:hypothetical protein